MHKLTCILHTIWSLSCVVVLSEGIWKYLRKKKPKITIRYLRLPGNYIYLNRAYRLRVLWRHVSENLDKGLMVERSREVRGVLPRVWLALTSHWLLGPFATRSSFNFCWVSIYTRLNDLPQRKKVKYKYDKKRRKSRPYRAHKWWSQNTQKKNRLRMEYET